MKMKLLSLSVQHKIGFPAATESAALSAHSLFKKLKVLLLWKRVTTGDMVTVAQKKLRKSGVHRSQGKVSKKQKLFS